MSPEDRIAALEAEGARLRAENESLRGSQSEEVESDMMLQCQEKFRSSSLFRGGEDTYPLRWESKTGRSGYKPSLRERVVSALARGTRMVSLKHGPVWGLRDYLT